MKVYNLYLQRFTSSRFGWAGPNVEVIGTFATEDGAKKKLAEIKEKFLANGPGFQATDWAENKRVGFSYGHEMGSMSFEPGTYYYEEQEVIG